MLATSSIATEIASLKCKSKAVNIYIKKASAHYYDVCALEIQPSVLKSSENFLWMTKRLVIKVVGVPGV